MKTQFNLLMKGMTKIVFLLLACFITMPTLNAVNVLPNVKVNQGTYEKASMGVKSKAIAVLNNTVYAVWQGETSGTASQIYFSKSIDGGLSFSTEINVSEATGFPIHYFASLYVSQEGKIHIAWTVMTEEGEANVLYTHSEDGGQSFKTPISLTTSNGAIFPCIGGYGNNVYVFYASMVQYPKADYYFVSSTNNGTSFGSAMQINDAPCLGNVEFDGLNTMTIGADGAIYLVWTDGRRAVGEGDIFFAKSVDQGLSFSPNVMVNDINGLGANAIQTGPLIAVEGDNVYVAFSDKRLGDGSQNKRAYLSVSTNGGSSFYSENLLAGHNAHIESFDIAVSESGKLSVALSGHISPNWGVWLYESTNKGMSFSTPIALDDALECKFHKDIQLLAIPGDYVCAFWRNDCGKNPGDVDYSRDIYFTKTSAQTTYIPDDNFLQALIDLGYGEGVEDKNLPTSNLSGIKNLDVSSKNISDLRGIEDFDALVSLNCSNNNISNFDISEKTALKELYCQNNQLSYIHLYNNMNLETLNCSNNKLMELNVFKNTALKFLHCNSNQLTSLDIRNGNNANMTDFDASDNINLSCIIVNDKTAGYLSSWKKDAICSFVNNESECSFPIAYAKIPDNNFLQALISLGYGDGVSGNFVPTSNIDTIINLDLSEKNISNLTGIEYFANLKELNCSNNKLSSLNVQSNSALEILNFDSNNLLNIDVSKNTVLSGLSCLHNKLTSLDVSKNTALGILYCSFNDLKSLDIRNGNNANITTFEATENPNLTCIYVNDKTAGYLSGWLKDDTAIFANNESECGPPIAYTHLPDNNFLQALKDLGFGAGVVNNNIPTANIDTITNLDVSEKNISDLTGIEDFAALKRLKFTNNKLTNLDISKNTALQILYCNFNQLSSLNISKNTGLQTLYCNNNLLSSLDVSKNSALKTLVYSNNKIANIDVSANTALTYLACSDNQIANIDVSANTALTQLNCDNNQLQSLDVSTNTALRTLFCNNNQLRILDLSKNIDLTYLICANNQLVSLDVRNGNNANVKQLDATENPNLTCIYVDDKTASFLSEWEKDATAKWANNEAECGTSVNEIDEQTISIYPNPTTGILNIDFSGEQVQRLTISDIVGKTVFEKNKVNKTEAIDLSGFTNGFYMLNVQTDKGNKSLKIIKK